MCKEQPNATFTTTAIKLDMHNKRQMPDEMFKQNRNTLS